MINMHWLRKSEEMTKSVTFQYEIKIKTFLRTTAAEEIEQKPTQCGGLSIEEL